MQGQSVVSQIIRCAKKSFMLQTEDEKKQSIVVKNSHKYMSQLIYIKKKMRLNLGKDVRVYIGFCLSYVLNECECVWDEVELDRCLLKESIIIINLSHLTQEMNTGPIFLHRKTFFSESYHPSHLVFSLWSSACSSFLCLWIKLSNSLWFMLVQHQSSCAPSVSPLLINKVE